jgi:subtilisin
LKRRVTAGALVLLAFVCSAATASAETLPGRYMVVLQDNVANPAAVAAAHADAYGAQRRNLFTGDVKAYSATIPADRVAAVRADPNVQFVSRERRYRLGPRPTSAHCVFHSPQATQQCLPQGADRIDAELSSTRSGDGRGSVNVNVAVVDSGIALDAPISTSLAELDVRLARRWPTRRPTTTLRSTGRSTPALSGRRTTRLALSGSRPGRPSGRPESRVPTAKSANPPRSVRWSGSRRLGRTETRVTTSPLPI